MKKYRHEFARGIDIVNDKALFEGAVTVADNVDLRSGSPRPIPLPTLHKPANADAVNLFAYRGRFYEADETRSYATGRTSGRDVVYFGREGKQPAKYVEGLEVPLGTSSPKIPAAVAMAEASAVTVSATEATGGIFKKDQVKSYRIGVETKYGVLPPGDRAIVRISADGNAVKLKWNANKNATGYIIFSGEVGDERRINRVSATKNDYTDTGTTTAFGETAASYEIATPYTYFYSFFRDVRGVTNESGPSPVSAAAQNGFAREIKFDVQGDGFFDQAGKVEVNTGITLTHTLSYSPPINITRWKQDANANRVRFETGADHGLTSKDKAIFGQFTDPKWNGMQFPVVADVINKRVFYVENQPVPTDVVPTRDITVASMIGISPTTYGFDNGDGQIAASVGGTPHIRAVGGIDACVLSGSPRTNLMPFSEPTIANMSIVNSGVMDGNAFGTTGITFKVNEVGRAESYVTIQPNKTYVLSVYIDSDSPDPGINYDDAKFVFNGQVVDIQDVLTFADGRCKVTAIVNVATVAFQPTFGFTRPASTDLTTYTATRFSLIEATSDIGLYIKTTGSPVTKTDYTIAGATLTVGEALPAGVTRLEASNYSVFTARATMQKVASLISMTPAPAVMPSKGDAVWAVINGTGMLLQAKPIDADSFEINAFTKAGDTCSSFKFVKDNGFLTHRYLYRTGDTFDYNLVEKIPIWQDSYTDFKNYNFLGDTPDGFRQVNGMNVLFSTPSRGTNHIAWHHDMLFGIDDNKVRWTPVNRPDAWPEEFFFKFEGKPVALASYGQALVVLCDDALYLIEGTEPTALTRIGTKAKNGCIAPHSVQATNFGLIYLSQRGLMVWNGVDAKCITDTRIPGSAFYAAADAGNVTTRMFMPTKLTQAYQVMSGDDIHQDYNVVMSLDSVPSGGIVKSLRSFYVDGKYYLYSSAADANRDSCSMWCVDLENQTIPVTTLGLKPVDVFVDSDETVYMLFDNVGSHDTVLQQLQSDFGTQLTFWDNGTSYANTGKAIYKFGANTDVLPWFIRTGSNSCGDPFERKRFRSVEIHTAGRGQSLVSFRIWIDGNYVCDGKGIGSEGPSKPRKVNIPQGRQLGYSIDVELVGFDPIRGIEINYDQTSQPS